MSGTMIDLNDVAASPVRHDLAEIRRLARDYVGRPTPLYEAERLSAEAGGARIFLKREDLAHTGAHKINNAVGQGLLAKRMGKKRIIAETGAGQHGVATATVCALLGLECIVYMGETDIERQKPNVFRMKLLGAEVRSVSSGSARAGSDMPAGASNGRASASAGMAAPAGAEAWNGPRIARSEL